MGRWDGEHQREAKMGCHTQLSHYGAQINTPRPRKGKKMVQLFRGLGRWDGEHEREAKMGVLLPENILWGPIWHSKSPEKE